MIEIKNNELNHIAMIMDGNRRWATERGLPKMIGHTEGGKNLKKIIKACKKREVKFLTIWALSTENLKERGPEELKHLFSLFEKLVTYLGDFNKNNIQVNIIGDISKLPLSTQKKLLELESLTKNNTGMIFTMGVNYGGHDEIVRAVKKIIADKLSPEQLTEEKFSQYLDTAGLTDPDLIIRTGGAARLSGYLPWQGIYSELYFTPTYWPAFSEEDLEKAVEWFKQQKRNRGK